MIGLIISLIQEDIMKKLIYIITYPFVLIVYFLSRLFEAIDNLFNNEERITELEDRINDIEKK
jgi:hypothetical protein